MFPPLPVENGDGPPPPKRFVIDPWQLVTPAGIDIKGDGSMWETGSVWCVLPVGGQRLLLGTEQGGLWLSEPDGTGGYNSSCLSNSWPYWSVWCLVADPNDATRVFVGCNSGGLYLGDASSRPAAQNWIRIPLPTDMATADIRAMIILPGSRVLVIGTAAGLAWLSIDTSPFVWNSVSTKVDPTMVVQDLAILAEDAFAIVTGPDDAHTPTTQTPPYPNVLSIAQIQNNSYVSNPVTAIDWSKTPSSFDPFRIGSCMSRPDNVYCLGMKGTVEGVRELFVIPSLFVIRSSDSGRSWKECQYGGNLEPGDKDIGHVKQGINFGDSGVKSRMGISVHPTRPDVVAIGYLNIAVSSDGGDSWDNRSIRDQIGAVADIHEICFDDEIADVADKRFRLRKSVIHVPSDDGISTISNWEPRARPDTPQPKRPITFDSFRNKTLPVVMLYSPSNWYGGYGNMSVSDDGGMIASGSQDESNLWCSPSGVWRRKDSGDGGAVSLSSVGTMQLLICNNGDSKVPQAYWSLWKNNDWETQGTPGTIPVRLSAGTLDGTGIVPVIRPVSNVVPVFTSVLVSVDGRYVRSGPLPVLALATRIAGGSVIYGAVYNPLATPAPAVEWIELVSLPPLLGDIIKVEPYSASQVLAGTSEGHLVIAKVGGTAQPSATALSYPYEEIEWAPFFEKVAGKLVQENPSGGIDGIAAAEPLVVAIRGNALYVRDSAGGKMERLSATAFPPNARTDPSSTDPAPTFAGIAMNRNPAFSRLSCAVVIRDGGSPDQLGEVWVSNSPIAAVWHKVSAGLPVAPRLSDVVFSNNPQFGELFLSTYGRGVWRTTF